MDIALYRIFLCNDSIIVHDKRLRDTYHSFAHSTNTSWVQRIRGGCYSILVGQKYDQSEVVPFLCGQTSLKTVREFWETLATIMTYLKILEKMPDQYCIWPRCPVEEDLNLVTNCTDLTNGLAGPRRGWKKRSWTSNGEKKHKRHQFGRVSLNSKACWLGS